MALVNEHFLKLASNYLFADIAKKVTAYKIAHPKQRVISLGIGDVTQPLCPAVIKAMHKAVDEMAEQASFRGYGPERGYDFLREAIIKNDFLPRGIHLDANEVFVNDGAKSDTGNIQEILRWDNNIGVTDPIYPVYIDSNVMIGRAGIFENGKWSNVTYMPCDESDDFIPQIPDHRVDMIYLCYPNNPTGTVISKEELRKWVNYAIKNESIILYDAAYEAYITDPSIPHSIYEIRGARKVAIEFHSYSKTAGFTGVRCGYTIVQRPKQLLAPLDADMASFVHAEMRRHGVALRLGEPVTGFRQDGDSVLTLLEESEPLHSDMVLLAIGVTPDTHLAKEAGLKLGIRGSIAVTINIIHINFNRMISSQIPITITK